MSFDTIIIGGGLSGLTAGIALAKAGQQVALAAAGQSTLNYFSGSFDLLGYDAEGNVVGKAVESYDNNGFGGRLTAMVGFDAEGNITGYEILGSSETPGLGAKADGWFQKDGKGSIIGKNPATNKVTVSKDGDGGEVDAITGSTITSRAFCRLVGTAYNAFKVEKGETK